MKNTFGSSVCVTLFGESHGPAVGAVVDGLAPGIQADMEFIRHQLSLRRPYGRISTPRVEVDDFEILSGVFNGKTTGTPLCIVIRNTDTKSRDYEATRALARPGHADFTAYEKYHGFEDPRGGGHFSGRITAALTAAGAVALTALRIKGIAIGTHIASCGGIKDRTFSELETDIRRLNEMPFAVLDEDAGEKMKEVIAAAAEDGDSVGGVLETAVTGVPAGIGEPWFDTVEGLLAHGLFSVPGIKGVQFGAGFDLADSRGSIFNDPFCMEGDCIKTRGNNNGGVNGGISNGMPIVFRCAVKPTPSIFREQGTVDFMERKDAQIRLSGRHDPAIIHRARVVVDSVTALVLCDLLAQRFGTDWLGGMQ
ncbi:MAG: chorismate synthase [Oscillospiraceae bacterium]|nr:chorismate synthase [Oscillospiraceae bacterium]